jgi:glycosyltransferase involved in cell wall biosynthesis
MKIVTMIGTLPPIKGISPYTQELCQELSKHVAIDFIGFSRIYPEFLYPGGTKDKSVGMPNIKNLKNRSFLTWYNPFTWIWAGFTAEGDIVHAQWWSWILAPVYLTILSIVRLRGKKIIITVHNVLPHEKSFVKNFLNRSVLKLANEYIVHSVDNKRLFQEKLKTEKPIHVIRHSALPIKKCSKSKTQLRKKYQIGHGKKVLLFFGNIRDYKGLDVLLNALAFIPDKDVTLIVAGSVWGKFDKYRQIIKDNKLDSRVKLYLTFIPLKTLTEFFKLCDVIVFPYREFEASSGAGAIALSSRKPFVVTNVGGLQELVAHKWQIAKAGDAEDLAKVIEKVLSSSSLNNKSVVQRFSVKSIALNTKDVYV